MIQRRRLHRRGSACARMANEARVLPQLDTGYVDEETGVAPLCTMAELGAPTCDGRPMGIQAPKALPASD
jgi:hypothetical protein